MVIGENDKLKLTVLLYQLSVRSLGFSRLRPAEVNHEQLFHCIKGEGSVSVVLALDVAGGTLTTV